MFQIGDIVRVLNDDLIESKPYKSTFMKVTKVAPESVKLTCDQWFTFAEVQKINLANLDDLEAFFQVLKRRHEKLSGESRRFLDEFETGCAHGAEMEIEEIVGQFEELLKQAKGEE